MFCFRRLPSAPDEIYSSNLNTLYLGHALWYPEPHVTGEVQIGDVGFIRCGAFVRLFNLDTSAPEKKVKFWPKPFENFEPLPPDVLQVDTRSSPLVPNHYCSDGVESREIQASADATIGAGVSATLSMEYICKGAQGAVLVLQSKAYDEALFENNNFKTYIIRDHDKWFSYARNNLGQAVQQEDITVVSGWVKTEANWAATAFNNTSSRFGASLKGS
ncbi:uncharacterized protein PHACADRAFT_191194 [Phanerochaete carnosa HHB-10118-sp]|uniref:Uncharacterized protein n=1 Tax=Phanerochaete carnosa (strain HHB-10118-sp) TaxID=650164 RepID=K5WHR8_PHACS|nr:uncharacterized protein PHACADRAFT_191194 [Phanerochaete carnosa HHB-10118-sp]EKM58880.1 hypothetical protein PHACADRAFT_191194 [Phanerochaete carnosa HHB-10118-sp]